MRPLCPCLLLGRGAQGREISDLLDEIGAPVIGSGNPGDLPKLLREHTPVVVVIDATSSVADLPGLAASLGVLPHGSRPASLLVVAERLLEGVAATVDIDDLVLWPAGAQELETRLARVRWRRLGLSREGLLRSGALIIDTRRHVVVADGREVELTVREYELLDALVRARGRLMTRERLLADVWGGDYIGGARTVDIHIRRLRAKLPEIEDRIVTVRGYGYRLAEPDVE